MYDRSTGVSHLGERYLGPIVLPVLVRPNHAGCRSMKKPDQPITPFVGSGVFNEQRKNRAGDL